MATFILCGFVVLGPVAGSGWADGQSRCTVERTRAHADEPSTQGHRHSHQTETTDTSNQADNAGVALLVSPLSSLPGTFPPTMPPATPLPQATCEPLVAGVYATLGLSSSPEHGHATDDARVADPLTENLNAQDAVKAPRADAVARVAPPVYLDGQIFAYSSPGRAAAPPRNATIVSVVSGAANQHWFVPDDAVTVVVDAAARSSRPVS